MKISATPHMSVCLLLLMLAAACGAADRAAPANRAETVRREVRQTAWDTLWIAGGADADTTLLQPRLVRPHAGGVYLYDDGRHAVLSFDTAGAFRWASGKAGSGPGEFRGVRDIRALPDGGVLVLDPGNSRVTRLDAAGQLAGSVPLGEVGHAEQVLPLSGGRTLLMTMDGEHPFVVVDTAGRVLSRIAFPAKDFAAMSILARQGELVAVPGGDAWVFAYTMGDGWYAFRDTVAVGGAGRYAEHTAFPEVETRTSGEQTVTEMAGYAPCSACSTSVLDSTLFIHFGGVSGDQKGVVDEFSLRDRRYLGSFRLPGKADQVAVGARGVYLLQSDSVTTLVALRRRR